MKKKILTRKNLNLTVPLIQVKNMQLLIYMSSWNEKLLKNEIQKDKFNNQQRMKKNIDKE